MDDNSTLGLRNLLRKDLGQGEASCLQGVK